ncbi:MAG TPA: hypothetical protein VG711_02755 [Phycisphaerales bacterium]|nr:hypothetical protein [Phycisphaerales bacterium]
MHEKRNFGLVLLLAAAFIWAIAAWLFMRDEAPLLVHQRIVATFLVLGFAGWLVYAFNFEDKLPDHLNDTVGPMYYEADGISFFPMLKAHGRQAVLSVYYQNRFENPAEVIVHLRPPADSFVVRPGMQDLHFAFRCSGGDYGVIYQPVAIPEHLQGEVIEVLLAAASYYPRSHGARLRKHAGMPCGSLYVDWGGAAFKTGVHEVSGEVKLRNPVVFHLAMPTEVMPGVTGAEVWKQQQIQAGPALA